MGNEQIPYETERKILIVDDDSDFADSMADILQLRNYKIAIANDETTAMNVIKDFDAHIALLDIRLGQTNGIDMIAKLKQDNIICVMVTAYASIETALEALQYGAYDYLRKPVNMHELFTTLDRCFEKRQLEQERINAEFALRKKENMLKHAQQIAHMGTLEWDLVTNMFEYSDEILNIFGIPLENAKKQVDISILDKFIHPDDIISIQQAIKKITVEQITEPLEYRIIRPDGMERIIWSNGNIIYDESGTAVKMIGYVLDITERKQAEKAILKSEEQYRLLAANVTDLLWTIDLNLKLTYVTPSIEKLRGFTVEETLAQSLDVILSPDSLNFARNLLNNEMESIKNGTFEPKTVELEFCHKDGSVITTESTISILYDNDKKPINILGVTRDITERKKAEDEREKMRDQLRQSQKMEAIGTLAGGIAHDFNNILSGIFGYTELALKKIPKDSPVDNYLQEILHAANRASGLVKQILTLSRQKKHEMKPINTSPVIKETIKLIRVSIPTTIEIRTNFAAKSDLVLANETQIHQIVMNLCANAAHAMQKTGGILTINLDNIDLDSDFVKNYPDLHEGAYLKLGISDTGHGISHDIIDRIFDPFFTTKQKGEGTGLGLSVIHGIIKSYGGAITVHSEINRGTTFSLFLPLGKGSQHDAITEELLPLPGGKERILLVDDEAAIVNYEKEMLQDLGYEVVSRTSSLEALEAFKFQPDNFNLVITDQTMPNMTGANMAREMITIRPDIPIILCTGFSKEIDPDNAGEFGICEFLFKPVTSRDMAEAVRRALEKKEAPGHEEIISGDLSKVLPFCGMKILVAEDIAANRNLMSIMLKNIGCESETVTNGKEALERIRDKAFDAVLMDINMPVMDGIEATRIIRNEIKSRIPVIALTGADIDEEKDKLLSAGIDDFLLKPISTDNLQNILQKWMR